jgi:outer membrane lipoprotein-sorting protein
MIRTLKLVVIVIVIAASQRVVVSQAPTLDAVFAKMEKANKDYPYLQGNIEKSVYNDLAGKTRFDGSGKIWISNAGNTMRRVRVEFDKPKKEIWNLDSGVFMDYFPGTKTGRKLTFDKDRQPEAECVLLGLCGSTTLLKQFYNVTLAGEDTPNGVKSILLELRPKDQKREDLFSLVKLWLDADKWYPVQTQSIEKNKNYNILKYSGFKTGSFSSSVFDLTIPKDADIETHKF